MAWTGVGFTVIDRILSEPTKLKRGVVGTHFYQTHPDFIERFFGNPAVRYLKNPAGVFHPKVYLFRDGDWKSACIIGSANFTRGGKAANILRELKKGI